MKINTDEPGVYAMEKLPSKADLQDSPPWPEIGQLVDQLQALVREASVADIRHHLGHRLLSILKGN